MPIRNLASVRLYGILSHNAVAALPHADDWRHPDDKVKYWRHRSIKCAEVLVPNVVETRLITGAYVYDTSVQGQVAGLWPELPTAVNKAIFFG